ncbi:hypothetical protein, partial [Duganella sp. CF517]|uniref:hypothetical protein n=1 Tax=Duganella sp. CF517 TaxID=1881038 RepID=UPI001C436564
PNRTVKQLCADDSAATSVKVGYRQASYIKKPRPMIWSGLFFVPRRHVGRRTTRYFGADSFLTFPLSRTKKYRDLVYQYRKVSEADDTLQEWC